MSYLWHETRPCSAAVFSSLQPPTLQTLHRLSSWLWAPCRVQPSSLWAEEIMKANPIMAKLSALITLYRNKIWKNVPKQLTWYVSKYTISHCTSRLPPLTHFSSLNSSGFPSQGLFVVRKSLFVYLAGQSLSSLAWLMFHCQMCGNWILVQEIWHINLTRK